jgi:hypothetical protein
MRNRSTACTIASAVMPKDLLNSAYQTAGNPPLYIRRGAFPFVTRFPQRTVPSIFCRYHGPAYQNTSVSLAR